MKIALCAGALVALSTAAASAAPMVYEPFDYADGTALIPGPGAEIGLTIPDQYTPHASYDGTRTSPVATDVQYNAAPNWIESPGSSDETTNTLRVVSQSLSRAGLPASVGNKLQMNDVGAVAAKVPLPTDHTSGSIYYSFLFNVNNVADAGASSFLAGLIPSGWSGNAGSNTSAAPLCIGINGTGYKLGIAHRDTAVRVFDAQVLPQDETIFVVARYDLNAGQDNDEARLYLFRAADAIPTSEPLAANVMSSSVGDTLNNDVPENATLGPLPLRSFMLRQNGVEPDGMQVDELRIGTTWDDAIGVPEPSGLAVLGVAAMGLAKRRRRSA